jgi:trigger factor
MRASSETIEGNKVRLSVEVDEPEVDKVIDEAIRTLSRQAKVPGFRPGKVPRQVLEARMGGAGALRAEALREAIPDFYAQALAETEVDPIAAPEIDITAGEQDGALSFDAVVEVRPLVAIPGYAGLKVTVPSPSVTDEEVDGQIDRLRETEAELVQVKRSARNGDHVTIDLHGTLPDGREVVGADDLLYEIGSGRVVPELDEQLRGAKVGDVLAFDAEPPAGAAGDDAKVAFRVLVKEVQEKKLPEVTDDWAAEASEFSTVSELRRDLGDRLARVKVVQAQLSFRRGSVAALAELVDDAEVPALLVDEETRARIHDLGHRLEEQGLTVPQLLAATGRTEEELLEEVRGDARQAVREDLSLRALAEAEGLDVTDDEVEAEIDAMAKRLGSSAAEVRGRLTRAGRIAAVRSEQRKSKALAWLLDHVEVVDEEGTPVDRDVLRVDQGTDETSTTQGAPDESGTAVTNGEIEQ